MGACLYRQAPISKSIYTNLIFYHIFESQFVFLRILPDADDGSWLQVAFHQEFAESVLHVVLNSPLQWAGTKLYIVSLAGYEFLCLVGHLEMIAQILNSLYERFQLQIYDAGDSRQIELVEGDDLIKTCLLYTSPSPRD